MISIKIGRPINGISLNGLEYVLDNKGNEMLFRGRAATEKYLYKYGYTDEDIENEGIVFVDADNE